MTLTEFWAFTADITLKSLWWIIPMIGWITAMAIDDARS